MSWILLIAALALAEGPTSTDPVATEPPTSEARPLPTFWDEVGQLEPEVPLRGLDEVWERIFVEGGPETGLDSDDVAEPVPVGPVANGADPEVVPTAQRVSGSTGRTGNGTVDEIIVWAEREKQLEQQLDTTIRAIGYERGKEIRDGKVYRPIETWRPSVLIRDDGLVSFERGPIEFGVPHEQEKNRYLVCLPPMIPVLCLKTDAKAVSPRLFKKEADALLAQLRPTIVALDEARHHRIHQERMQALPARLEVVWAGPGTDQERRAKLLEWRDATADTPEGLDVRQAIDAFLDYVGEPDEDVGE